MCLRLFNKSGEGQQRAVFRDLICAQGVVKRFFNEKEVTSTLVMDALFSGCKQLEEAGRTSESKRVSWNLPPLLPVPDPAQSNECCKNMGLSPLQPYHAINHDPGALTQVTEVSLRSF